MNCRSFRKRQAELLDSSPDPITTEDILEHAANCPKCARELREARTVINRITPSQRLRASSQVKERIMNSVNKISLTEQAGVNHQSRYYRLVQVGVLTTILLLAIAAVGWFTNRNDSNSSPAFTTLAQAAEFAQGIKSMHISARMRTIPGDNFEYIDPKAPLIPVEIWKEYGNPSMIYVKKPGRHIVFDGESTTMFMQSKVASFAVKNNGFTEGVIGSLAPLLNIETLFQHERQSAENANASVTVGTGTLTIDGKDIGKRTVLTINAKAQGDFSESEYSKNTSIIESDNTRIYMFDPDTSRCDNVKVYVKTKHENVLVFETTKIEYDIPIKPSVFHLDIPKSVTWLKDPSELNTNTDNSSMQPDEVARGFFEALSKSDWQAARQFSGSLFDNTELRRMFGGLRIISIGKPFKSGMYRGCYVPYEIKLKSGQVKKFNLAIRNDNSRHQWSIDGGL